MIPRNQFFKRRVLPVLENRKESHNTRTIIFEGGLNSNSGQFYMLGIKGKGEKPFSPSFQKNDRFGFTICDCGSFSHKLATLKPGESVSIRGGFGNSFPLKSGEVMLVGGGAGTPPLYLLTQTLLQRSDIRKVNLFNGAATRKDLIFSEKFKTLNDDRFNYKEVTDETMSVVELAMGYWKSKTEKPYLYASGSEGMLKALYSLLEGKKFCFLMERYMKCGIGLCGSCICDTETSGIRMCVEGPVIEGKLVAQLTDFGIRRRVASGRPVQL